MTRNNADFENYIRVYRGLDLTHPDELSPKGLGRHWTTDRRVADRFAEDEDFAKEQGVEPQGVVIHAKVHKNHVVVPHTEEWDNMAGVHGILDPESSHESEVTIRPGSPVHVDEVEHVTANGYRRLGKQFDGTA